MVAGVALTLVLGRSWRDRAAGLVVVPFVVGLGVAACASIDWLFMAR